MTLVKKKEEEEIAAFNMQVLPQNMEKCVIGTTFKNPGTELSLNILLLFISLSLVPFSLPSFDMVLLLPPPNIFSVFCKLITLLMNYGKCIMKVFSASAPQPARMEHLVWHVSFVLLRI